MARSGHEPALTRQDVGAAVGWARVFPSRSYHLVRAVWRADRGRVLLVAVAALVLAVAVHAAGTGLAEVRELVLTLALAVLVLATSRDHRTVGAVVVTLLALSLVGSLAGPRWAPLAAGADMEPQTSSTVIGGAARTHPVGTYKVAERRVSAHLPDGTTASGLLRVPVSARGQDGGDRPGVVFLHGAGTHTLWGFAEQATALASAGAVTLVPDKPSTDYTLTSRDYVAMADDYAAWVALLRGTEGVDAAGVGVYAESEGAYPGMVLAGRDPSVAFLVLASAPVVPMRDLATFAAGSYLDRVGVPAPLMTGVARLLGARRLPGGSFTYADFDATVYARRMRCPVLMLYGTADSSMPLVQGPQVVRESMAQVGNTALTVRYYRDANHGLKLGHSTDGALAPGVARDLARWVTGLPSTGQASPAVAGATPVQDYLAKAPGRTRWYASGDLMLGGLLAGVALLLAAGAGWLVGQAPRLRGGRGMHLPDPIGRWLGALALAVVAAWVVYLAYIGAVARLAVSYRSNPWLSYGGWWVAQAVAVLAVVIAVRLCGRVWLMRGQARQGRDTGGRWLTVPAGCVLLSGLAGALMEMVALAYWGLFPALL